MGELRVLELMESDRDGDGDAGWLARSWETVVADAERLMSDTVVLDRAVWAHADMANFEDMYERSGLGEVTRLVRRLAALIGDL